MKKIIVVSCTTGILVSTFSLSWFELNILQFLLVLFLSLVSVTIGLVVYFLGGFARADGNSQAKKAILDAEQKLSAEIQGLQKDLLKEDQPEASKQAGRLLKLLEDFNQVIKQKLGDSQIAQSSYVKESTKVFKLVKQNLQDILIADISVRTVEEENEGRIPEDARELVSKQKEKISQMIESNKELLKALNVISVEVANIKDLESFECEQTLHRLKDLANRAKDYSKQ